MQKAGREYGFSPKFIRMQTLHAFLFYIIYEHAGKPRGSKETLLAALRAKGVSIDETLAKQIGGVFNLEVGWKMFVPPLPKHSGKLNFFLIILFFFEFQIVQNCLKNKNLRNFLT